MLLNLLEFHSANLDAVFFDFDGVLVDSVPLKTSAYQEIFRSFGERAVELITTFHRAHGGVDRYRKIAHVLQELGEPGDEASVNALAERFSFLVKDKVIAQPLVEGMDVLLETLNKAGVRCFVVSGTPEAELRDIVQARSMGRYFVRVCGSPATKVEILRSLARDFDLRPDRCIFLGDARTDFEAAQEYGCFFFGVPPFGESVG